MRMLVTTAPAGSVNGWTRSGLYLSTGLALADLPTILYRPPEGNTASPAPVLALLTLCGAITLIGVIITLVAGFRGGIHVVAISRITSVLLGIPSALSATMSEEVQSFAIYSVPMGVLAVALLYHRSSRPQPPRSTAPA